MGQVAHVAVAEDDPDMRGLVANALRRDGYQVVELEDGAGLRSEVAEPSSGPIDLIVSDIQMPVVNGLTVLRGLRESRSTVPVVLMTAFGDDSVRKEAVRLGAVVFSKPFKLDELRSTVRTLLEEARK
jgi:DNA-binding response OmpR family regulator